MMPVRLYFLVYHLLVPSLSQKPAWLAPADRCSFEYAGLLHALALFVSDVTGLWKSIAHGNNPPDPRLGGGLPL